MELKIVNTKDKKFGVVLHVWKEIGLFDQMDVTFPVEINSFITARAPNAGLLFTYQTISISKSTDTPNSHELAG
jgi:hypothetical protein